MEHEIIETTLEWCGECECEVELKADFEQQKCPECGADITPCTLCVDIKGHNGRDCAPCELEEKGGQRGWQTHQSPLR